MPPSMRMLACCSPLISQVEDDGKGWVWLAAEMSPGGLAVELFKSVPYGTLG